MSLHHGERGGGSGAPRPARGGPDLGLLGRRLRLAREERRRRRKERRGRPAGRETVADVYRALGRGGPRAMRRVLHRWRAGPLSPRAWRDAVVATLLLRWAEGRRAEALSVLDFAAAYYDEDHLDRGLARAARLLEVLRRAGRPLAGPANDVVHGTRWASLAARARTALASACGPRARAGAGRARPRRRAEPVVLHLTGGLGNQMFQFAAAQVYADRVGANLRVDLRAYERAGAARECLLGRLRAPLHPADPWEVARALAAPHRQAALGHDAVLVEARPGVSWLAGFWEHPIYFRGFEGRVEEWFAPRDEDLAARARGFVAEERPAHGPLVAVHVRRGDRVPGRPGSVPHRALPLDYFREAMARYPADARFLVFSDGPADVEACRADFGGDPERFRYAPGRDPIFDLVAMAACDGVVASASTFSWWAAWLGRRPGRLVVVPDPRVGHGPVEMEAARPPPEPSEWLVLPLAPPDRRALRRTRPPGR